MTTEERVYKNVCDMYVTFDDYGLVKLNCITIDENLLIHYLF